MNSKLVKHWLFIFFGASLHVESLFPLHAKELVVSASRDELPICTSLINDPQLSGVRVTQLACPPKCVPGCKHDSFVVQIDDTEYYPFGKTSLSTPCVVASRLDDGWPPPKEPMDPGGICNLIIKEVELHSCGGFPVCGITKAEWTIASKYVDKCMLCRLSSFRPFHRIGSIEDIHMIEGEKFSRDYTSKDHFLYLASQYVDNFNSKDMSIVGPDWLRIEDGYLIGVSPTTGQRAVYEYSVTARNTSGTSDPLTFRIIVDTPVLRP